MTSATCISMLIIFLWPHMRGLSLADAASDSMVIPEVSVEQGSSFFCVWNNLQNYQPAANPVNTENEPASQPMPVSVQIRKETHLLGHFESAHPAKLSARVLQDFPGAVIRGTWDTACLEFTLFNRPSGGPTGTYKCEVNYLADKTESGDARVWIRELSITDNLTYAKSHPPGFDFEATFNVKLCITCPTDVSGCNITKFEISSVNPSTLTVDAFCGFVNYWNTIVGSAQVCKVYQYPIFSLSQEDKSVHIMIASGSQVYNFTCMYSHVKRKGNCTLVTPTESTADYKSEHTFGIIIGVIVPIMLILAVVVFLKCNLLCGAWRKFRDSLNFPQYDHNKPGEIENSISDVNDSSSVCLNKQNDEQNGECQSSVSKTDDEEDDDLESELPCEVGSVAAHGEQFNFNPRSEKRISTSHYENVNGDDHSVCSKNDSVCYDLCSASFLD